MTKSIYMLALTPLERHLGVLCGTPQVEMRVTAIRSREPWSVQWSGLIAMPEYKFRLSEKWRPFDAYADELDPMHGLKLSAFSCVHLPALSTIFVRKAGPVAILFGLSKHESDT